MKKMMKLSAIFVAFALLAASFMGCDDGGGGGGTKTWTVTWNPQGGKVSPTTVKVKRGDKLTDAQIPTPSEFPSGMLSFTGWWTTTGTSGGTRIGTTTEITGNVTYYARYSATETITITVNVNRPATYTGAAIDAIAPITMAKGAIGGALPGTPVSNGAAITDMTFLGWFLNAAGTGDEVIATTTFDASATIFAKWEVIDTETQFILVFDLNYAVTPKTFQVTAPINGTLGDDWPADPVRTGYIFGGWWTYENGNGSAITSTTTLPGSIIDNKVWAKWSDANASDETPPDGWSTAGVEKVNIGNGFKVIYVFNLPSDKTYSNYDAVIAKFAVGDQNFTKTGMPRTTRIHGNYLYKDFGFISGVTGSKLTDGAFAAANFNDGKNAEYIMGAIDTTNQSGTLTVESWVGGKYTENIGPWDWFDVSYPLDGTNKHSNFVAANMPAADNPGPFAFGIGFDAMSGDGGTHYIKDVYMKGADANTANLKGYALYLKRGETTYPAFCGYLIGDGSNGCGSAYRAMMDNSTDNIKVVDVTPFKVTFNLNYAGAPDPEVRNVERGATVGTLPTNPTREDGSLFVEWNSAQNGTGTKLVETYIPEGDYPVYAKWSASAVTITFNGDGGTPVAATKAIAEGGSLEASDLVITRPGYLLNKWVRADGTTTVVAGSTTFSANETIKAIWDAAVTVTIDLNTGAAPTSKVILKNTSLGEDFPANPTKPGEYTFTGWNSRVDGSGLAVTSATVFDKNTTIYAQWDAKVLASDDLVIFKNYDSPATAVLSADWARSSSLIWAIPFPAGINAAAYQSVTVVVKYFTADGEEVVSATSNANGVNQAQFKFAINGSTPSSGDSANAGGAMYNLGANFGSGVVGDHTPIPGGFNETYPATNTPYPLSAATHCYIQRSNPTGNFVYNYIEVYEITLHAFTNAITINVETLKDPVAGTIKGGDWSLGSGNLKITAPVGLDGYAWTINGAIKDTSNVLTINASDYVNEIGKVFTVTLLAMDATGSYSQTVIITVKK